MMSTTPPTTTPTTTLDLKRRALGRGLESLLPRTTSPPSPDAADVSAPAADSNADAVREIPLELINPNPYQTRTHMDEAALAELAASILANGVVQPIVVRYIDIGRYELIAGHRRWAASQRAGKATIPALVRQVSDEQAVEMTIVENLQREDLNPMEQAHAFERLSRDFGLTQEQMAQRTGKDRASISNFIRLLRLPAAVQTLIAAGQLSMGHAKALMMLDSEKRMMEMAERVVKEALSVRQTEEKVHEWMAPAGSQPERQPRRIDPNVRALERELEGYLGMRVRIQDRGGRGRITFEYGSLEQFDSMVERLKR
jgi:ParB family chromosome partitioning protein